MTMYAGVKAVHKCYDVAPKEEGGWDGSSWFGAKKALKLKNPLMNLPYVVDGDVVVAQTNAVLAYLGRKLNLWGKNEQETIACEQLLSETMDLRNNLVKFAYGRDGADSTKDGAKSFLDGAAGKNGILQKIELWLGQFTKGDFLVGGRATAPDFHLWELLDQMRCMAQYFALPLPLASFPKLRAFYESFGSLPKMQPYLKSALHKLPHNQKMAKYGANPDGSSWAKGQKYDWADAGGIY